MQDNNKQSDKLFYGDKEIGPINSNGEICHSQNQKNIESILDKFPYFLSNSLPEGERYDKLLLNPPSPIHSLTDVAKCLDELPGNFYINKPQHRTYVPVPDVHDSVIYAETNLPVGMFHVHSDIRTQKKPSFSGYQDKFTAQAELVDGKLLISLFDPEKEYGNVIVKPTIKLVGIGQNEYACMKLAEKVGLKVPRVFLIKHPDNKSPMRHFCIERFDFTDKAPFGKRETVEFASMMGLSSKRKYEAKTEELFQNAEKYLNDNDMKKLSEAYFYGVLIRNGDMHTKNFSMFVNEDGSYQLTPIYDMVNTHVHGFPDMLALPFGESCNPNPPMRNIIEFLESYINKYRMYEMIKSVENNLGAVLASAFSQEINQDSFTDRASMSFCKSLEESILSRVNKVKEIIN